jgi:predicted MFS family arabinose efflux permease
MKTYITAYLDNFRGFSREIWVLTIITFINRAGAMVMPFLAKYLHDNLSFTFEDVGWMMACIGLGSLTGSWIGGKLTDKIGFYTIMLISLFLVGFGFISLMFLYSFTEICIGLFVITAIADMYKPAMYVAVASFSTDQNRTRSLTLVRLAVNLGLVTGPVLGGLVVASGHYDLLFWADGLTCLVAIIIFMLLIDSKKITTVKKVKKEVSGKRLNILKDNNYVVFLFASFTTAFLFFQLFTTIPIYNSNKFHLSQIEIGLILSLNGILIFLLEMPFITYLEKTKLQTTRVLLFGSLFMASGFLCLLVANRIPMLVLSIVLITIGEIMIFSFSNTFALSRAKKGFEGRYMAMYAMCFSVAQILSPKIGFAVIGKYSFMTNWILMSLIGVLGVVLYFSLNKKTANAETNLILIAQKIK